MAEIAKSWFEFKEDERMKVVIEDGLKYIQSKGLILVHLCHLTRFPDCPKPGDGREMFTSFCCGCNTRQFESASCSL